MATNAELAAKLLRASANFFRAVGEQNPELLDQMQKNADACELIAGQVETDPLGVPADGSEEIPDPDKLN